MSAPPEGPGRPDTDGSVQPVQAPAGTGGPQLPYVEDMLGRLYPPPLRVAPGSARGSVASFHVLPSPSRPRLVVPAGHPYAAARAVRRQLTGRRARTRLSRAAIAAALGSGALDALSPRRLSVTGSRDGESIETVLRRALDVNHLLVTMPVGPPRANRKPVLQVTDHHGEVIAFVKVGHDELTRSLVRAEGAALSRLADAPLSRTRVPGALACEEWNGLSLLAMEPLPVAARPIEGDAARTALLASLAEITTAFDEGEVPWEANRWVAALRSELAGLVPRTEPFLRELERLDAVAPALRVGAWHGDLNPGNVAVLPDGVLVWDWERFELGVPAGFDLLHHDLHRDITVRSRDAEASAVAALRGAPHLLSSLGIGRTGAAVTARLYLLALVARYLRDDQEAAGAVLGRVEEWILPALRSTAVE